MPKTGKRAKDRKGKKSMKAQSKKGEAICSVAK